MQNAISLILNTEHRTFLEYFTMIRVPNKQKRNSEFKFEIRIPLI